MKSIRSYQREAARLRQLVAAMQWVQPTYNGSPSCSCCGEQKHFGCSKSCDAAKLTGDFGGSDNEE